MCIKGIFQANLDDWPATLAFSPAPTPTPSTSVDVVDQFDIFTSTASFQTLKSIHLAKLDLYLQENHTIVPGRSKLSWWRVSFFFFSSQPRNDNQERGPDFCFYAWSDHHCHYLVLAKITQDDLSISVTSYAEEQVFSLAADIPVPARESSPTLQKNLLCVGFWEWLRWGMKTQDTFPESIPYLGTFKNKAQKWNCSSLSSLSSFLSFFFSIFQFFSLQSQVTLYDSSHSLLVSIHDYFFASYCLLWSLSLMGSSYIIQSLIHSWSFFFEYFTCLISTGSSILSFLKSLLINHL